MEATSLVIRSGKRYGFTGRRRPPPRQAGRSVGGAPGGCAAEPRERPRKGLLVELVKRATGVRSGRLNPGLSVSRRLKVHRIEAPLGNQILAEPIVGTRPWTCGSSWAFPDASPGCKSAGAARRGPGEVAGPHRLGPAPEEGLEYSLGGVRAITEVPGAGGDEAAPANGAVSRRLPTPAGKSAPAWPEVACRWDGQPCYVSCFSLVSRAQTFRPYAACIGTDSVAEVKWNSREVCPFSLLACCSPDGPGAGPSGLDGSDLRLPRSAASNTPGGPYHAPG